MANFKFVTRWLRSCLPADYLYTAWALIALGATLVGCRLTDLSLEVREVDIFHEQGTDAFSNAVDRAQNKDVGFLQP